VKEAHRYLIIRVEGCSWRRDV